MDKCQENDIEVLSEWLRSLRITKENALDRTTDIKTKNKILTALPLVVYNKQAVMPKSIVPDPR